MKVKQEVERALFGNPGRNAYAVLDGARRIETRAFLEEYGATHRCLFSGDLDDEIAAVAPYLLALHEEDALFDRLFDEGWGDARGIFLTSDESLSAVRAHLRTLVYATLPDGELSVFRFYDPRAMRLFWPVATPDQMDEMFGEIVRDFVLEKEDGEPMILSRARTGERA